jgi:hypothetical protein
VPRCAAHPRAHGRHAYDGCRSRSAGDDATRAQILARQTLRAAVPAVTEGPMGGPRQGVGLGGSSETASETRHGYFDSPTASRASVRSAKIWARRIFPCSRS